MHQLDQQFQQTLGFGMQESDAVIVSVDAVDDLCRGSKGRSQAESSPTHWTYV